MSVPELQLVFPLEGRPKLYIVAVNDRDAHRLLCWLDENVDLELIARTVEHELEQIRRAA